MSRHLVELPKVPQRIAKELISVREDKSLESFAHGKFGCIREKVETPSLGAALDCAVSDSNRAVSNFSANNTRIKIKVPTKANESKRIFYIVRCEPLECALLIARIK